MLGTFVFWNSAAEIGEAIVENRLISSISINLIQAEQLHETKKKMQVDMHGSKGKYSQLEILIGAAFLLSFYCNSQNSNR